MYNKRNYVQTNCLRSQNAVNITNRKSPRKIDFADERKHFKTESNLNEAIKSDLEKDMEYIKDTDNRPHRNMSKSISKTASRGMSRSKSGDSSDITNVIKSNLEILGQTNKYGENLNRYENVDADATQFNMSSAMILDKTNVFEYSRSTSENRERRLQISEEPPQVDFKSHHSYTKSFNPKKAGNKRSSNSIMMHENIVNFKEVSEREIPARPRDDIIYLEEIVDNNNIDYMPRKAKNEDHQMEGDDNMTGLRKARIDYYTKKLADMEANYSQRRNSRND